MAARDFDCYCDWGVGMDGNQRTKSHQQIGSIRKARQKKKINVAQSNGRKRLRKTL